jgi:hypothetical protein
MVIVSTVKKVAKRLGLRNNSNSNSNSNSNNNFNRGVANLIRGLSDAEAKKVLQAVANSIKNEKKRKQIAKNEKISRQLQVNENLRLAQQMSRLRANNTGAGPSIRRANRNPLNRFTNANMNRVYRQSSFNRVNVPGNGSCFYHAVLLAGLGMEPVRGGGNNVRNLREGVRQQIRNYYRNYRDNQHVATTGSGAPITKRQFINSLNNMGCSASTAEVMAAARVLNRRIVCLCASPGNNSTYRVYPPFTIISYYNTLNSRNSIRLPPENPIYLYYDGYFKKKKKPNRTTEEVIVSGAHFQSLIPKRGNQI